MPNQEAQSNSLGTLLITLVATLGGFLFGYDSGVINGTVDGLQTAFNSESIGTGFSVASMLLGCAVGAFLAGWLADMWGRRTLLLIAAVCFIISAWGSGVAASSPEFIVYRVLGGLAVGAASVMAPAYISEIAPTAIRGRLSSIQQIAIITGLTAAFFSNYILAGVAGNSLDPLWFGIAAWRWMFWMEIIPATVFLAALFWIPRSPRFLISKNKEAEAVKVLKRLGVGDTLDQMVEEIKKSLLDTPRFADIFSGNASVVRPIIWTGIGLAVFQQLVGINVIFYYGAVLWQSVGFTESDALLTNVITGAISILACVLALATIDRIGRKPLLMIGSLGMGISLALMALAFGFGWNEETEGLSGGAGVLALISANIYVFLFNLSWGPVMWVLLGEMFPNRLRGSGLAVSGFFQWIANFAITMSFPILLVTAGLMVAYGFYAVSAFVSLIFVAVMVRETRGKKLEEMEG